MTTSIEAAPVDWRKIFDTWEKKKKPILFGKRCSDCEKDFTDDEPRWERPKGWTNRVPGKGLVLCIPDLELCETLGEQKRRRGVIE